MSNWIKCSERLPDDATNGVNDAVQLLVYVNVPSYGGSIRISTWMNNRFAGFPQGGSDVTHWQPLPDAPEAE